MITHPRNDPNRLLAAAALGVGISALIIWIPARGHVQNATFGDGQVYRYIARHLFGPPGPITAAPVQYGRIGLPSLLWLLSGGSGNAMPYVQPIVMMLSGGAIAAATAALLPGSLVVSAAPFAALGLSASLAGGFTEPLAVALCLCALVLIERDRWGPATAILAAAILTKETALAVVGGIIIWQLLRREYKGLVVIASVVPYLAWGLYVASRYGAFPLSDPWWRAQTVGTPFVALWRTLSIGGTAAIVAGIHAGLGVFTLAIWRRNRAATIALITSVQILVTTPVVWGYLGDGLRSTTFFEVFLILAVLGILRQSERNSLDGESNPLP
jgi:hypothetical protein